MRQLFVTAAYAGALLGTGGVAAAGGASTPVRCEWPVEPQADHYAGTVEQDGVKTRFITSSTWVLIGGCDRATIVPVTASGRRLIPVRTPGQVPAPAGAVAPVRTPTSSSPAATGEPAPQESAATAPDDDSRASPPAEPTPEAPAADTEEGETGTEPATSVLAGVWIGIGRESIRAEAGISDFDGQSPIGGTGLLMRWRTHTPRLTGTAAAAMHRFRAEISEENTDGTTLRTAESRILRAHALAGLYWNLAAPGGPAAPVRGPGGGLAFVRFPKLAVADAGEKTGRLDTGSATGPWVGGLYETSLADGHIIGAGVKAGQQFGSASTRVSQLELEGGWRLALTGTLQVFANATYARIDARSTIDCPEVTSCSSSSTSETTDLQLRAGVAAEW